MNFWKKLNNRSRILLLLLVSLVLLNTIVLLTTHNLRSFSGSFASMLNDRLVPIAEIGQIQEYVYKNRLHLEHMIFRNDSPALERKITENNRLLDSTFHEFAKSHFTDEEGIHARYFLLALKQYRKDEQQVLNLLAQKKQVKAERLFEGESNLSFQQIINELHLLSGIQISVGKLLYEHADDKIQLIKLVAYFSLAVSIVVAAQTLKVLGIKPS